MSGKRAVRVSLPEVRNMVNTFEIGESKPYYLCIRELL